jgi:hypothetical protein
MRDDFVDRFGEEMGNWLACRAGKDLKDRDCISDFSIVEKPKGLKHLSPEAWKAMGRHEQIRQGGCCGSFDTEYHHYKTGRRFLLGFNYGH